MNPDAELIALCDRMVALHSRNLALYAGPGSPDDPDNDPVVGPLLDAICDELRPIRARLADMAPATLAGARAMARAALADVPRTSDYALLTGDDPLLYAVTEWLAGDYAAYLATPPDQRNFTAPPQTGQAHPDAGLLALAAEVREIEAERDRLGEIAFGPDGASADPWPGIYACTAAARQREGAMADLPARTLDGLREKARIAFFMLDTEENGEPPDEHPAAWSLCRDLLALAPDDAPLPANPPTEALETALAEWDALADRIIARPATSPAEILRKASLLRAALDALEREKLTI